VEPGDVERILSLQRAAGNRAVASALREGSGIPVHLAPTPESRLPAGTPAWTAGGEIFLRPETLLMGPASRNEILRHEAVHAVHQRIGPPATDLEPARTEAEDVARSGAPTHRQLSQPAPSVLGFGPEVRKPWGRVWVGHGRIIGEIVAGGVTVRIMRSLAELGFKETYKHDAKLDLDVVDRPAETAFFCGKASRREDSTVATMKQMAAAAAAVNAANPSTALQATSIVIGNEASGYRLRNGAGVIAVEAAEFDRGEGVSTVSHEASHGVFEGQAVAAAGKPSAVALRVADLFLRLSATPLVAQPGSRFDPRKPPKIKVDGAATQPAGLVMVTDMLWAGSGGHPWENVDEFFASALGGYLHAPKVMGQIADYYVKQVGGDLGKLRTKLFALLAEAAKGSAGKVSALADATAAAKLFDARAKVPDWSQKAIELLDPNTLQGPSKPACRP
jgi:hypothetical protein